MTRQTRTASTLVLCLLLAAGCGKNCKTEADQQQEPGEQQETTQGMRIAYVEIDSLTANYQLCKDYTEIGNMEAENIKKTLESKQRTLEQHYQAMQQKYQNNGFTSQEELDKAQASLQKEQSDLEDLTNRLGNSFQEQQQTYNDEMRDSIQKFLKAYNRSKKFDLILSKAGDNILLANTKLDITAEVLKGLNKRYHPSAEVKEKLKRKTGSSDSSTAK